MSIFEFDGGGGTSNSWNYAHPENEGYSLTLTGDVVELSEVQSINYRSKKPEFWEDGNPKLNVCLTIMQTNGEETNWIFSPGGRGDKASNAMKAVRTALQVSGFPGNSLTEIAGCNITVATQPGVYNNSNPRPWGVQINGRGTNPYRGTKKFQAQQAQPMQQRQAPKPQSNVPMQPQQLAQMAQQAAQQVRNNAPVQPQVQPVQQVPVRQVQQTSQYQDEYVPYEETEFYYTGE